MTHTDVIIVRKVGFITFDSAVHFYVIKANQSAPHMMVVGDVDNIFLPVSDVRRGGRQKLGEGDE